ncbi:MAG: cytochrome ubiquinol oxidase subunit I [Burkholderiaceae bacterium]|nr:cytochrome ubiquinol oxidase subunit I [Burkholderiaceae bacterium]
MDSLDGLLLARIQFAANITFHILFPTITIALGWALLAMRLAWLRTRHDYWLHAYRFWTKVFALSFALGVVSGITMSFQFGTNWPGFMERVGNVAGPLLGYEVLTAFFLEATFLGIMLFGHGRVSERVHLVATFLVAFGTTMSAFWIIVLNSWMQTPAGYEIVNGVFHVTSWIEVIFNPSMPYRLAHMLLASFLTVAFLICGVSAWQLLRGKDNLATRPVLKAGLVAGAALIPAQIFMGDLHGLNTLEHQPAKIAAMEAIWKTERGAPLVLFALPDAKTQTNRFAVEIPRGAALILTHEADGELKGIDAFPNAHPPVAPVFFSFRVMVGVGVLMLVVSWLGAWYVWRQRRLAQPFALPRWMLLSLAGMTFSGWVATVAGWYVSEVGRQPFLVQGYLRTAEAASSVPAPHIALTLTAYLIVYALLIVAYVSVLRYMAEKPLEDLTRPVRLPGQKPTTVSVGAE